MLLELLLLFEEREWLELDDDSELWLDRLLRLDVDMLELLLLDTELVLLELLLEDRLLLLFEELELLVELLRL